MREYCREKGSNVEFEKLDPKELDWSYYMLMSGRKMANCTSLVSLLIYSINKHLLDSKKLDIPNDPAFANSIEISSALERKVLRKCQLCNRSTANMKNHLAFCHLK